MRRHPIPALLAGSAWAFASAAVANEQPLQTQRCNDPPPAFGAQQADVVGDIWITQPTGKWLHPGMTLKTKGTDIAGSPELNGSKVFTREAMPFSFDTTEGLVAGVYREVIVQGTDWRCKSHVRVEVQAGCIARLTVHGYLHPQKLVADYRSDLGDFGDVPSRSATRSAEDIDGRTTVTFNLPAKVCAGQASRWLLLNTNVKQVRLQNSLQFFAPGNQGSPTRFPFFVP
jgi:hypothetical protein